MFGRAFLLGSLVLGTISATPIAEPASATVESKMNGGEVAAVARGMSGDHKIDTVALWAREWFATADAPVIATRDLDWTTDGSSTDEKDSVAKRGVDIDDVVDTMAAWTKELAHTGESPQRARAAPHGETVDETIDRVAGKVKSYFQPGGSLSARDVDFDWDSIFQTIIGWLENVDWNSIIKTLMTWLEDVNFNSIFKAVLTWIDSTFFGGSSSATATPSAAAIAARTSSIDWSSIIQKVLTWAETLL